MSRTIPNQSNERTIPDQSEGGSGTDLILGDAVYNDGGIVKPVLGDGTQISNDEVQPILGDAVEVTGDMSINPILGSGVLIEDSIVKPSLGSATQVVSDDVVPILGTGTRIVGNEVIPEDDYRELETEIITLDFTNSSAINMKTSGDGTYTVAGRTATVTNTGAQADRMEITAGPGGRFFLNPATGYNYFARFRNSPRIQWNLSSLLSTPLKFGDLVKAELFWTSTVNFNGFSGYPAIYVFSYPGVVAGTAPTVYVSKYYGTPTPATSVDIASEIYFQDADHSHILQSAANHAGSSNLASPLRLEWMPGTTRTSSGGTGYADSTYKTTETMPLIVGFGADQFNEIAFSKFEITIYRGYLSLL